MKKSLLKLLILKLSVLFFSFLFYLPKIVHAEGGVGVHHYNLADIEQIKREMAAGMPVTFWATPADGNLINELNEYNKSLEKLVPMFIEDPYGLKADDHFLTLEERQQRNNEWIATLGQLEKSPAPPFLMPTNEDFTWRCHTDASCFPETARILVESNIHMYNAMIEAGIGDKFILASPMLNITHPGYYQFVAEMERLYAASTQKIAGITPAQYPDLFGIWLLNEYVTINSNGSMYLQDWQSAWTYTKWSEIPKFAKELGARTEAGVTYDRNLVEKVILEFLLPRWLADPTHFGGTILNLEGLVTPEFLEFLKEIGKSFEGKSGIFSGLSPADIEKYQKYLDELLKNGTIVKCPQGGYARSLKECEPPKRPEYTCSTSQQAMEPKDLRPAPCESCSDPLGSQTDSCGTPFQAYTNGEWCLDDVTPCDSNYTKAFDWGGEVTINFTQTKVPFAGYGDSTNLAVNTEEEPSTTKYLADYFDGILFYGPGKIKITPGAAQRVFSEAGVFRRLAPAEVQDDYKLAMIGRAHRSQQFPEREKYPIRDYVVKNPDPENHPDCQDKKLTQFITELGKKPMRRSFNSELEYQEALKEWEEKDGGCWRVLWTAVPMFTREDGVGEIYVSAHPPGKISPPVVRATFPHLPRLYEVTQALQQMLFPQWPPHSINLLSQNKTGDKDNLLASTENFSPNCLGEQTTLLAQGEEPSSEPIMTTTPYIELHPTGNENEYEVVMAVNFNSSNLEITTGHIGWDWSLTVDDNPPQVFAGPADQIDANWENNTTFFNYYYNIPNPVVTIPPGTEISVSVTIKGGGFYGCRDEACEKFLQEGGDPRGKTFVTKCTMNADGTTTCTAGPGVAPVPPPSAVCKSPDSHKACFDPKALTDDNPNDPICVANSKNGVLYPDLDVPNYQALITRSMYNDLKSKYDACMATCGDEPGEKPCSSCEDCSSVELSRWISIKTKIPWLNQIWKQTTALEQESESLYDNGLFHIFTPAELENWEEKQAKSPIAEYGFEVSYGGEGGGVKTDSGWLYYPKLGGVQEAKECLSEIMLLPAELRKNDQRYYEICPPFREQL